MNGRFRISYPFFDAQIYILVTDGGEMLSDFILIN